MVHGCTGSYAIALAAIRVATRAEVDDFIFIFKTEVRSRAHALLLSVNDRQPRVMQHDTISGGISHRPWLAAMLDFMTVQLCPITVNMAVRYVSLARAGRTRRK